MTIEEFVNQHAICDAGLVASQANGSRDLKDAWDNVGATWLFWLLSRARVDQKLIVRAVCACVREVLPLFPESETRPRAAVESAEGWCDGFKAKDEVLAAAQDALSAGNELRNGPLGEALHVAAGAAADAGRCVRTALHAPGVASAIALAIQLAGGKSVEEAEADLGKIVRRWCSWEDVEKALAVNPGQYRQPEATVDDVVAQAEHHISDIGRLLDRARDLRSSYEQTLAAAQFTPESVTRAIQGGETDGITRAIIERSISALDAADAAEDRAASGASSRPAAARGRARRMMV